MRLSGIFFIHQMKKIPNQSVQATAVVLVFDSLLCMCLSILICAVPDLFR